jgi:hypothetical protein
LENSRAIVWPSFAARRLGRSLALPIIALQARPLKLLQ